MRTKQHGLQAHRKIALFTLILLFTAVGAAADWRDVASPELANLISPDQTGNRLLILVLEPSTAPDSDALSTAYSYVSRTTWSSETMRTYREQLSEWCELELGWRLQRNEHVIWEASSAYIAFAHALVVRCAIKDIPQVASLPFVVGIQDGEATIPILQDALSRSVSSSQSTETLFAWTENGASAEDLARRIAVQGWMLMSPTFLEELVSNPFADTALSNTLPSIPDDMNTVVGLSANSLVQSDETPPEDVLPWPYGEPIASFGPVGTMARADLLLCVDTALHADAAYITLCELEADESTELAPMVALLWKPAILSGVASTGPVAGTPSSSSLPLSGIAIPEVVATMGSHPDRVVLEWEKLAGTADYEILRAIPETQVYESISIASDPPFSDWNVETCVQYKYVIRALSENGVGLASEMSKGFIGEVPEIVEWIEATDSTSSVGGIDIEWAPAEKATIYNLWRSDPVKTAYQSNTKVYLLYRGPETSFLDLDVVPGITYHYCAVPYNGCGASAIGNPGDQASAMFLMPPEGRPRPPEWLTASLVTPADQVNLSWRAVWGVDEYRIYRASSYPGPYELMATLSELKWSDTSAVHCQDYWYRIQSVSGDDAGPMSSVAHGVCGGKPGLPSGIMASDRTYTDAIRLDWGAGHEADFYQIFRATSIDGPYTRIGNTEEHTYVDVGLEPGQTFWYRVIARNACGGSGYTDPVWGATTY